LAAREGTALTLHSFSSEFTFSLLTQKNNSKYFLYHCHTPYIDLIWVISNLLINKLKNIFTALYFFNLLTTMPSFSAETLFAAAKKRVFKSRNSIQFYNGVLFIYC